MGIALNQWKALFKAYHCLAENFKFIKGLVHNLHKTGRRTLVGTMIWFYPDNIEIGSAEEFLPDKKALPDLNL